MFGLFGVFFEDLEAQTTLYPIGEPTAEEQLGLELINRARLDPAAEGIRLAAQALVDVSVYSDVYSFGTNLNTMKAEMAAIAPAQPLSFNANLLTIARIHNDDMLAADDQTHFATSSPKHYWNRMDNGGYVWSEAGENIFAAALNIDEAHASFEIDWGSGSGGMQSPRGHRNTIHSNVYREIGIGFRSGSASNVGPNLLTQNFGERISRSTIKPYVTGVAIHDADGDGFYDIGEGIAGVTVKVKKVATGNYEDHYAVTSGSGGYSVPVDAGAGNYLVEFEVPGGATHSYTVTITSEIHNEFTPAWERGFNIKADLILNAASSPAYTPPLISGETQIPAESTTIVDFDDVIGVIEYEVLVAESVPSPLGQNAEASAPVTTDISSSYSILDVPLNQGDRIAFHLTHMTSTSGHQSMILDRTFVPSGSAQISFASRLRRTGTAQIASLQVTTDGGDSWTDVWYDQQNFSYADELAPVSVDVSQFEGQPLKFRFFYYLGGGTVEYGGTGARGWHFDDLEFTGMSELIEATTTIVTDSEYPFTPAEAGPCHLQVRARSGSNFLPYASATLYAVSTNDYSGWVNRKEAIAGLPAGTLADSDADYDGDGLTQLFEYALEASGLNPLKSDASSLPTAEIEGDLLCVHYARNTSITDVILEVQVSTDLTNWYSPGDSGSPAGFTDTLDAPAVGTQESRTASVPIGGHDRIYMRVRVLEL